MVVNGTSETQGRRREKKSSNQERKREKKCSPSDGRKGEWKKVTGEDPSGNENLVGQAHRPNAVHTAKSKFEKVEMIQTDKCECYALALHSRAAKMCQERLKIRLDNFLHLVAGQIVVEWTTEKNNSQYITDNWPVYNIRTTQNRN